MEHEPSDDVAECREQPATTPSEAAGGAGPVTERERIVTLDVLRGFALFGILMVNMPFFAMPFMLAITDPSLADAPLSERLAFHFVRWFFEYKFVSLFSLLFGIGFIVQLMRARSRGGSFVPLYLRRLAVLFFIGLVHAFGLWYGDILLIYSIVAVALLIVSACSPRTLMLLAGVALVIGMSMGTLIHGAEYLSMTMGNTGRAEVYDQAEETIAAGEAPSGTEAMKAAHYDPNNPIWIDAELRAYRDGPLIDALAFRAASYGIYLFFTALTFGWHVLSMFLLGAAMMKVGFFRDEWRHWHRRLALIALPVGLALEGVHVATYAMSDYELSLGTVLTVPLHEIGSVLTMLGYVGVFCLIVRAGALAWLTGPLASAGRMALTVYLSMTVVATGIMYWWGLGQFGSVSRAQLIGLAVLIYLVLITLSVLWLRTFRYGPLEWLWRATTYMRLPELRR